MDKCPFPELSTGALRQPRTAPFFTLGSRWFREPFLSQSHLLGVLLGIFGTAFLMSRVWGDAPKALVALVYGLTMVLLFLSSSVFHGLHCSKEREEFLERLDYVAIYMFIAGTYTPVSIYILGGKLGTALLIAQWSMAAIGSYSVMKSGFANRWTQVGIFLAMGWMFVATLGQLLETMSPAAWSFLILGSLCYSVGAVIFACAPPRVFRVVCSHSVWHLLVLCGASSHFGMIYTALVNS